MEALRYDPRMQPDDSNKEGEKEVYIHQKRDKGQKWRTEKKIFSLSLRGKETFLLAPRERETYIQRNRQQRSATEERRAVTQCS